MAVVQAGERVRILVVDDEPDTLDSLVAFLQQRVPDVEVLGAASGPQALQAVDKADRIDMVLTDYRMPAMDGLELLEAIHARWPDAAGMMLTAYPDVNVALGAIRRGKVVHFFTKPPDPRQICDTVRRLAAIMHDAADHRQAVERFRETLPSPPDASGYAW